MRAGLDRAPLVVRGFVRGDDDGQTIGPDEVQDRLGRGGRAAVLGAPPPGGARRWRDLDVPGFP